MKIKIVFLYIIRGFINKHFGFRKRYPKSSLGNSLLVFILRKVEKRRYIGVNCRNRYIIHKLVKTLRL